MALEVPLVLEIEKHECLYNFTLTEYNRKDILDQAWQEVATAVNLPVRECKDKWRNIRSSFLRSLKTLNVPGARTKKPYYLTKYLQFVCPYLKPIDSVEVSFEDNEKKDDDANDDDANDDDDDNEQRGEDENTEELRIKIEPVSIEQEIFDPLTSVDADDDEHTVIEMVDKPLSKLRKRKRRRRNESMESSSMSRPTNSLRGADNFAMRYFLLSLLPEFDSMNERQIRQFKIKVMKLIEDIKTGKSNTDYESRQSDSEKRLINLLIKNLKK